MQVSYRDEKFVILDENMILPTHSCFDDVMDFMQSIIHEDSTNAQRYVIFHGICLSPDDKKPFAHAWLESIDGKEVLDGGIIKGIKTIIKHDKHVFYRNLAVQSFTRYTRDEWIEMNNKTCHYGPWEKKYKDLCKEYL